MDKELVSAAMLDLSGVHRARAKELAKNIPAGYPRWNHNGSPQDAPVQDFYFQVGENHGVERIGTKELELYARDDNAVQTRLKALVSHLCGNP